MLNKSDILGKTEVETKSIHVKAWGGDVTIKRLTIKERESLDAILYEGATLEELQSGKVRVTPEKFAKVSSMAVSFALIDENGKQMFSEDELSTLCEDARTAINEVYQALEVFDTVKKSKTDASSSG